MSFSLILNLHCFFLVDPVLMDEEDAEADVMGPDVISAFRSFKSQLLDHVFVMF